MPQSRRKGHDYERATAAWYRSLGFNAERGLQSRDGHEAPDVIVEGQNLWIECCKRKQGCWIIDKWKQAEQARDSRWPVLHVKQDRGDDLVVISREHWGYLIGKLGYASS